MSSEYDVFISYARADRDCVVAIVDALESLGVSIWRDENEILGGEDFGPKIIDAIKRSQVMLVMCSAASMKSRNVQTEISVAWDFECRYLPLLLDESVTSEYPSQIRYWLQRSQWIVVRDRPREDWLSEVAKSLRSAGIACKEVESSTDADAIVPLIRPARSLEGLLQMAAFTDRIWPVRPHEVRRYNRGVVRDMGERPPIAENKFRLGEWVCLRLDVEKPGHLRLINIGTSGKVYGLCPSKYAPDTKLPAGDLILPQVGSPWEAFYISGSTGREQLLAIVSDESLDLDWTPRKPDAPTRILDEQDCIDLLSCLGKLDANHWSAQSTYFDVVN